MQSFMNIIRVGGVFLLGLIILALSATGAEKLVAILSVGSPAQAWFLPALTHLLLVILSSIGIVAFTKGQVRRYGLVAEFHHGMWRAAVLSMFIGLLANFLLYRVKADVDLLKGYSLAAIVGLVWIWASVSEEIFCRGLLQSLFRTALRPTNHPTPWRPGAAVVLSALFFCLMHLPLVMLGATTRTMLILLPTAFALGWIAGYLRDRSGSVLPAIVVHALFNISGSIVDWLKS